jgi:myo-inositol 2-dehydrogenase/D-chiro-inositol 1-dehydrogenase
MKSGTLAVIDASRKTVYGYDQRVEVFCSKGSVVALNDRETNVETWTEVGTVTDKPLQNFQTRYANSYLEELRYFIRCILNNEIPSVTPRDAHEAMLVAKAATISARENRPIIVDDLR